MRAIRAPGGRGSHLRSERAPSITRNHAFAVMGSGIRHDEWFDLSRYLPCRIRYPQREPAD